MDKEINLSDWPAVKKEIESDGSFHQQKRQFIVDRLSDILGNEDRTRDLAYLSFSELIDEYSDRYDSLNSLYKSIRRTNEVLDEILEVKKAESISLDKDRGFIIFTLNFNEVFEDSIEYMILTYQYIDDYDNLYFSENSKLSSQAAGKFVGNMQSIMTDIFTGRNEIIYLKSELSAAEVLQENYGLKDSTEILQKEYLSEGLKVKVSAVQFNAGGIMKRRNGEWEYLN